MEQNVCVKEEFFECEEDSSYPEDLNAVYVKEEVEDTVSEDESGNEVRYCVMKGLLCFLT